MWVLLTLWLTVLLVSSFQQSSAAYGEQLLDTYSFEGSGYVNSIYFTNWGVLGKNYHPKDFPVSKITHLLYALMGTRADGTVYSINPKTDVEDRLDMDITPRSYGTAYGCVEEIFHLKKKNPHFKVLLSIGGWTLSSTFPAAASTPVTRKIFASSAVKLMTDWGFDGIDVDWEYPSGQAKANNFLLLLKAFRDELNSYARKHASNHHFELSIAALAGPDHYQVLPLSDIGNLVDCVNLMAYDYAGSRR